MSGNPETPDTIYGRLLESVHISGYSASRACDELEWLLEGDRWKSVGKGFENGDDFIRTINLSEFRLAVDQRKKLAKKLAEIQGTQRAIGKALGVSPATVNGDVQDRTKSAPAGLAIDADTRRPVQDRTPATIVNSGTAAAEQLKRQAQTLVQREAKEQQREERRDENKTKVENTPDLLSLNAVFATIAIDPPWDFGDEGDVDQFGRGRPTYHQMPFDEIAALPVPKLADVDCHLYLWITNRSLPKGFTLIERWGFRYVTCLTWCKPSFGMGNYFRGSSEQILFAVKGSQPLKRKDVGTWFRAPRREAAHSSKPVAFYELVESCSPGPYLDVFSRTERPDWKSWGADA